MAELGGEEDVGQKEYFFIFPILLPLLLAENETCEVCYIPNNSYSL